MHVHVFSWQFYRNFIDLAEKCEGCIQQMFISGHAVETPVMIRYIGNACLRHGNAWLVLGWPVRLCFDSTVFSILYYMIYIENSLIKHCFFQALNINLYKMSDNIIITLTFYDTCGKAISLLWGQYISISSDTSMRVWLLKVRQ